MTQSPRPTSTDPALDPETHALFEDWAEAEAHVDLSDIRPWDAVSFLLFWALFGVVFLQFVMRYVFNDSPGWTEEIARYLLIGVTFVGSVLAMRKGTHIAVEALFAFVSPRTGRTVHAIVDAAVMGFCGFLTWTSAQLAMRTRQLMASVDLPKSVIYWVVCASLAAMTLFAAWRLYLRLTGRAVRDAGLTVD